MTVGKGVGPRPLDLEPGGALLPYFSTNLGLVSSVGPIRNLQDVNNLDENQQQEQQHFPNEDLCDNVDGASDDRLSYPNVGGHGTHVVGLVGANGLNGTGVRGTCLSCSIAVVKMTSLVCNYSPTLPAVGLNTGTLKKAAAMTRLLETGVQVINMSYGAVHGAPDNGAPICSLTPPSNPATETPQCLQIRAASERDIVMVASSGNARKNALNFPARDPRVVAVGGVDDTQADTYTFWDMAPGLAPGFADERCPLSISTPNPDECGSNYSEYGYLEAARDATFKQELVAPAREVLSTFPPGKLWHEKARCGDRFGVGTSTDGQGECTGTSMSAPIVSGIVGLVRSINPLLPAGDPFDTWTSTYGVRDVLKETSDRSAMNLGWDPKFGHGVPNAGAAVRKMLGVIWSVPAFSRLTPLFGLYNPVAQDYAAVATPQLAMALASTQESNYYTTSPAPGPTAFISGAPVPGYTSFPKNVSTPLAMALVLTTQKLNPDFVQPQPLYLLDKCANAKGEGCNATRDFVLVSDVATANAALAAGYRYLGVQGYVHPKCSPEPGCVPPGSEQLLLQCSTSRADCAVFLESQRNLFQSVAEGSYTRTIGAHLGLSPDPTSAVLGYAYPVTDSDNDGLPDGFERILGTSPSHADSDGDVAMDGAEYPLATVPVSDPCNGPGPSHCTKATRIFGNGYE